MIILGIDPGLASTGFGALRCDGPAPVLLKCGHIKTFSHDRMADRLMQIHQDVDRIIDQVQPDLVALEDVFSLVRYPRAGILLGSVLGVLYLTARQKGIPVQEIAPKEIKNSLVGFGNAGKKQIKDAVVNTLKVGDISSFHASDALAVALAVYYRRDYRRVV
ncbi:MAG: crossover junction endodeoxyribonuclease RuvC [Syntrophorhabdaceae bacterium]|nr:crossover junction endodeoxyribonuclease RuvC [Syntrophorhabdaceae bacterium]